MNKQFWSCFKSAVVRAPAGQKRSGLAGMLLLGICLAGLPARADSLWAGVTTPTSMMSDKRAIKLGDILNIIVQENSTATKDASTKTAKKNGLDASISSFLFSPQGSSLLTKNGQLPAFKYNYGQNFDGSGTINNSEKIVARIAVTVIDVLPNDNLVIEGTRQTSFSGESQDMVLRGVVRPTDVAANNTVYSYNVANATIKIVSKGTVSDNTKKGWFLRIFEKVTPF